MQSISFLTALDSFGNADVLSEALTRVPSHTQIQYSIPPLPALLSLSAYLYLLSATSTLAEYATHAPLIGPLITGVLLGPSVAGLLSPSTQQTLISLGYIGLVLIVFEAGLTTHLPLLIGNIGVSAAAALTGVILPIALSIALLHGVYGYTKLQSFAAGAALCSTSLGTTLALLTPKLRKTRVGSVLMCAALLDDVVGLVIAGIIANLANSEQGGVKWEMVVRPVLVSIAFGLGTPALAWVARWIIRRDWGGLLSICHLTRGMGRRSETSTRNTHFSLTNDTRTQLFFIVCTLLGFVAGSSYAGTSELFGAYLAGTFLAYIFDNPAPSPPLSSPPTDHNMHPNPTTKAKNAEKYIEPVVAQTPESEPRLPTIFSSSILEEESPTLNAFNTHISPILTPLLGPIFFASVGAAIPVGSLFTTTTTVSGSSTEHSLTTTVIKSHTVVWKGIVYALLMAFAKAAVGLWMVVWQDQGLLVLRRTWKNLQSKLRRPTPKVKGSPHETKPNSDVERGCKMQPVRGPSSSASTSGQTQDIDPARSEVATLSPPSTGNISTTITTPPRLGHANTNTANAVLMKSVTGKDESEPTPIRAALLLGLAMIARGEIALIVAQLARPLLVTGSNDTGGEEEEEPYAVVIWAVVLCTLGGALGVGWLLGRWEKGSKGVGTRSEEDVEG